MDLTEAKRRYLAGESPAAIAEAFGTYPNAVRRALLALGVELRGRRAAAAAAYRTGRKGRPSGRREPGAVRAGAAKAAAGWAGKDAAQKARHAAMSGRALQMRTPQERYKMKKKAARNCGRAGARGTRMAAHLLGRLPEAGVPAARAVPPADLLLADGTAVCVDGHYRRARPAGWTEKRNAAVLANCPRLVVLLAPRTFTILKGERLLTSLVDFIKCGKHLSHPVSVVPDVEG
jgi:hypothetical protein